MIAFIVSLLVTAGPARAQYGFGAYGALHCPTPFAPAAGAVNARDPLLNSQGLVRQARVQLGLITSDLNRLDLEIRRDHVGLVSMFNEPVFQAIEAHREYARGPGDYATCPGAPAIAGPALLPFSAAIPPPTPFCVNVGGHVQNYWRDHFVRPNGLVDGSICRMQRDFRGLRAPPAAVQQCLGYLNSYYAHIQQRLALKERLAAINAQIAAYETDANAIRAGLTESGRCVGCDSLRAAGLEGSAANALLAQVLQLLLAALGGITPGAGFGANALQFPARPYATARVPGLYGIYGNQYGAPPGAIGPGSFAGCLGETGLGLGGEFAAGPPPFLNARATPVFASLYQNPIYSPNFGNGLFNTGYGPRFGPVVGNGLRAPSVAGPATGFGPAPGQRPAFGLGNALPPIAPGAPGSIALGSNILNGGGTVGGLLANGPTFNGLAPGRLPLASNYLGVNTGGLGGAYAPGVANVSPGAPSVGGPAVGGIAPSSQTMYRPALIR